MASKRVKKKQQKRELEKRLQQTGLFSKKEIKRLSKSDRSRIEEVIKQREKEQKVKERNERARRVYRSLINEGVDPKTARKMRYMSQDKIDAFLQERRRAYVEAHKKKEKKQRKKIDRKKPDKTLLIFWRDKNDYTTDPENFEYVVSTYKYVSVEYLILECRAWLPVNGGEIGDYMVLTTSDPQGYKRFYTGVERGFYSEWILAYEGYGDMRRYRELLIKVCVMLQHLYYATQKMAFVLDLIRELAQINDKTARRLQKDLRIQYV